MNKATLAVVLLLAGCATPDGRLAKENADLKAQQIDMAAYIHDLQRERSWLYGRLEDMHRELDQAKGRRTF